MKYLKIINEILICIAICLCIFLMLAVYKDSKQMKYDLNNDHVVNSADLLYLRKYLLESEDE